MTHKDREEWKDLLLALHEQIADISKHQTLALDGTKYANTTKSLEDLLTALRIRFDEFCVNSGVDPE